MTTPSSSGVPDEIPAEVRELARDALSDIDADFTHDGQSDGVEERKYSLDAIIRAIMLDRSRRPAEADAGVREALTPGQRYTLVLAAMGSAVDETDLQNVFKTMRKHETNRAVTALLDAALALKENSNG